MDISKKKEKEKQNHEEVKVTFKDWAQDPEDKSRPATVRETLYQNCHIKEFAYEALKENDQKWMTMRCIDNKQMDAITRLSKTQDKSIRKHDKCLQQRRSF